MMLFEDKLMTDDDTFKLYVTCKLHFRDEKFSMFKYSNVIGNRLDLSKRNDAYMFSKLRKLFPRSRACLEFLVSNFLYDPNLWVRSLLEDEAWDRHIQREKRVQALSYTFKTDLKFLYQHCKIEGIRFSELFVTKSKGFVPEIITKVNQGDISLETFVLLDRAFNFIDSLDQYVADVRRWKPLKHRSIKYSPFVVKSIGEILEDIQVVKREVKV